MIITSNSFLAVRAELIHQVPSIAHCLILITPHSFTYKYAFLVPIGATCAANRALKTTASSYWAGNPRGKTIVFISIVVGNLAGNNSNDWETHIFFHFVAPYQKEIIS